MASPGSAINQALIGAVRRLLRPLVRVLIENGMTFPAFVDLVREAYVDAAFEDFAIGDKPLTISRVMVLTGIHRREVTRLAKRDRVVAAVPLSLSLSARVVAKWLSDDAYLNSQHQPRPLPRSTSSDEPSFNDLVASISKDIRPNILLDEWRRLGVVNVEDGLIELRTAAFVPSDDFEEKAYYFGRHVRDHIAASAHNLAGGAPPVIDRAVYEDSLSDSSLEELRLFCEKRGSDLLLEVYQKVRQLAERDRKQGKPERRMTFGVYFFSDQATTVEPADSPDPGSDRDAS